MSLPDPKVIRSKKEIVLKNLGDVQGWLRAEVPRVLSEIAVEENSAQQRLNPPNNPTSVRLDRKVSDRLTPAHQRALARAHPHIFEDQVQARITFLYSNTEDTFKALVFAYAELISLTRKLTGRAVGTYYFYLSDPGDPSRNIKITGNRAGMVPRSIKVWFDGAASQFAYASILGPTTEYRRKLIYNPAGTQRTKWVAPSRATSETPKGSKSTGDPYGKPIDRYAFVRPTKSKIDDSRKTERIAIRTVNRKSRSYFQAQVSRAIQEIVMMKVRRRFKNVYAMYRFVRSREPLGHDYGINIPELFIGAKRFRKGFRSSLS